MDVENLEFFKERLEKMRDELESESEMTVHNMQEESTLYPDPTDRAALESEHITTLRIRDRERKLLVKVDAALERIANGTFGECEDCGGEIGIERLKIRPVTTLCIQCKSDRELEEKHK